MRRLTHLLFRVRAESLNKESPFSENYFLKKHIIFYFLKKKLYYLLQRI
ncbi:hypothetical protein B488_04930 [Liberibacter crescens BT-1]|uniref:Uncharacterized protein n=1 Tax=Liberibacter crescens (strain BT-1) TaxID=1215343 RepID=L0EUF8_LIBCB|nr:hypothetical protein B488_04930 [Liberibacter crescens BT-1]